MNEIQLNARELLYLSAQLGAAEFFGIADPFMGMGPEEIRGALAKARISLDEKGLAQMSFDGSFEVMDEAADLVRVCAFCDAYHAAEFVVAGKSSRHLLYFHEQEMVLLLRDGDALTLRRCEVDEAVASLCAVMAKSEHQGAMEPGLSETIPFDALAAAQKELCAGKRREAETILLPYYKSAQLRGILLEGLGQVSDFYHLMLISFKENAVDSIMCIAAPSGMAGITKSQTQETCWTISALSPQELDKAIRARLSSCLENCGKVDA